MKILVLLIAIYTPVMLLIHLSTGKILRAWNEQPDSWIRRWFPPRRALRTEGIFWLLALAAWFFWRPLAWKVLVVIFAVIHLSIWGADEFAIRRKSASAFTTTPVMRRVIVAFDLVEAFVLAAVEVIAVSYLTHAR
jgi:hypothetical protein